MLFFTDYNETPFSQETLAKPSIKCNYKASSGSGVLCGQTVVRHAAYSHFSELCECPRKSVLLSRHVT
jgi:hypothetical protein